MKMNKEKQRGATSILTVLFVSMGIAAAFYTANSLLKSYQDSALTAHSLTQSQNLAWKAEEMVNNYLNQLYCGTQTTCAANSDKIAALQGTIPVQGMDGVTIQVLNNQFSSAGYLTLNIKATTGGSTVSIQSVHKAKGNSSNISQDLTSAITVNGNTQLDSSLNVTAGSSGVNDDLDVKGNLTLNNNQTLRNVNATGDVTLNGNSNIQNLITNGSIQANGSYNIGFLQAGGDFSALSTTTGTASGSVAGNVNLTDAQQATNQITSSTQVNGFDINAATPNAYNYRSQANYILDLNSDTPSVYVQNVAGIANGWYPIGSDSADSTNQVVMQNICQFTPSSNCLSYSNGTWEIKQQGINPGIVWVNGSLSLNSLGNAKFINSFIATGNINVAQQVEVKAFNMATSIEACEALHSPTNYCVNNTQTSDSIGNIALLAGGYGLSGAWMGGNITTASDTTTGHIIAGSSLTVQNNMTLNGGVIVSGQGLSANQQALNIANGLTINLSNLNNNTKKLLINTNADETGIYAKWVRYN